MQADVRKANNVTIVDLAGDLVVGDGDEVLRAVFEQAVAEGWPNVLLNFAHVGRMDSSGIGELVRGWKTAKGRGVQVKLLRPGDRVRYTLHLSQILPLLEVYENEDEALRHF